MTCDGQVAGLPGGPLSKDVGGLQPVRTPGGRVTSPNGLAACSRLHTAHFAPESHESQSQVCCMCELARLSVIFL